MSDFLAQNSEYVRRDYALKQDVTTALDFQGKVNVPLATQPTHAVQFSQLDSIKQDVLTELRQQVTGIQLETIKDVTLEFTAMSGYFASVGMISLGYTSGQVYYGSLGLIPLLADGARLYAVAWTAYQKSKTMLPQDSDDFAYVWLSEDYGTNSLLNSKRVIADPDNLTDADLEYFEQYGGVDNLLPIRVNIWGAIQNYNNWCVPAQGFMTNIEKITLGSTSTAANFWWCTAQSCKITIKLPYENRLYKRIVALQFSPIAVSVRYVTNNIYGVPQMYYRRIWNDKYIDTDVALPPFVRMHSCYRGIYINMPFNHNETYNDVVYDSTIKDPNCSFPTTTYKNAIKGFWREATKSYEFVQYPVGTQMTYTDPDWWRQYL